MWLSCLECGISSGCGCHVTKRVKHPPRDHKKELERYQAELDADIAYDIEKEKRERNTREYSDG